VVDETLQFVLREMTSPQGPFYSTQDADSEGEEGRFFVWSAQEIENILGPERAEVFTYVYNVDPQGNWEGHNILHRSKSDEQDARMLRIPQADLQRVVQDSKRLLFEARSRRVWPGRDEKILTSWNGLMIEALALAAGVLDNPLYAEAACKAADFILASMRAADRRLLRTWSAGSPAKLNGYLDDYAYLLNALVSLYEATFQVRWIEAALEVADRMIDEFWDAKEGGFFYTGRNHEQLITRAKDTHDSSTPSGNSMATEALLRLVKLTGRRELGEKAEATLRLFAGAMATSPLAVGQMLVALDFYLGPVEEYAVVGEPAGEDTRQVLQIIRSAFHPNKVLAFRAPAENGALSRVLPLLADKPGAATVTTYICKEFACQAPITGVEQLQTKFKE
jgi:hypothetical protein